MNNFDSLITELAELRQMEAEAKAALDELMSELKTSETWQFWSERLESRRASKEQLENDLRMATVLIFTETGDKRPHPALGIREVTKFNYDASLAHNWCLEYLPKALKLDARAFEKYAKAVADVKPVPYVEIYTEPQATIATNLSKYLVESAGRGNRLREIEEVPL